VSQAQKALVLCPVSIVEAIAHRDSESFSIFCQRYERGLRFLIRRHHVSNEDECFSQIVNASFAAVLNGEVSRDVDLAGIIQHNFRRVLLGTSLAIQDTETSNRNLPETARAMGDLVLKLKMFKSHQFNALFRFYIQKESASSICRDLRLLPEEFDFIRTAAKEATRLSLEICRGSRQNDDHPMSATA
jgi:hypothetical protein